MSGLFTTRYPEDREKDPKNFRTDADIKKELDDEDEMLYGNTDISVFDPPKTFDPQAGQEKTKNDWWRKWQKEIRPSYWLVGVRDNGDLEIYTLPDFKLSYAIKNFWLGKLITFYFFILFYFIFFAHSVFNFLFHESYVVLMFTYIHSHQQDKHFIYLFIIIIFFFIPQMICN